MADDDPVFPARSRSSSFRPRIPAWGCLLLAVLVLLAASAAFRAAGVALVRLGQERAAANMGPPKPHVARGRRAAWMKRQPPAPAPPQPEQPPEGPPPAP